VKIVAFLDVCDWSGGSGSVITAGMGTGGGRRGSARAWLGEDLLAEVEVRSCWRRWRLEVFAAKVEDGDMSGEGGGRP